VADHNHRNTRIGFTSNGFIKVKATFEVKIRVGLVKEQYGSALGPYACQMHPLALPARQLVRWAMGEMCDSMLIEHLVYYRSIYRRLGSPAPAATPPRDDLDESETRRCGGFLVEDRSFAGEDLRSAAHGIAPEECDRSRRGCELAGNE